MVRQLMLNVKVQLPGDGAPGPGEVQLRGTPAQGGGPQALPHQDTEGGGRHRRQEEGGGDQPDFLLSQDQMK